MQVRDEDVHYHDNGIRITHFFNTTPFKDLKRLAIKINLIAFIHNLWANDLYSINFLQSRKEYTDALVHFYYDHYVFNLEVRQNIARRDEMLESIDRLKEMFASANNSRKFYIQASTFVETTPNVTFDCPICLETEINPKELIVSACNHSLCKSCFQQSLDSLINTDIQRKKKPCCSLCRAEINQLCFASSEYMEEIKTAYFTESLSDEDNYDGEYMDVEEDDVPVNLLQYLV